MNFQLIQSTLKSLHKDRWLKESVMVSGSLMVGGAIGYVYHITLGRLLGAEVYADFGALLGLFYLLWLFSQSSQLHLARTTAQDQTFGRKRFLQITVLAAGIFILMSALSLPLGQTLGLDPMLLVWMAAVWLMALPLPVFKGILQGKLHFKSLALLNILEPVVKLLLSVVFVLLGMGLWGAWAGWGLASLLTFAVALGQGKSTTAPVESKPLADPLKSSGIWAFWLAVILAIPTNVDVILVKQYFSNLEAGLYTSAAVIGKAFLFLALGASSVLLPKAAQQSRISETRHHLTKALLIVGTMGGIATLVGVLFPGWVMQLLFGQEFLGAADILPTYCLAMLAFTGLAVILHYGLAQRLHGMLSVMVLLGVLEAVTLGTFHETPMQMATLLLGFHLSMLVLGLTWVWVKQDQPDSKNKFFMVSTYPTLEAKHGSEGGVASYTQNLVEGISKQSEDMRVLGNGTAPSGKKDLEEVIRCWQPGLAYPFRIWKEIRRRKPKLVHLQHELFLYGPGLSALMFPLLLLLIRSQTKVVVTLHGFLPLSKLSRTFIQENGLKGHPKLLYVVLYSLIRTIVMLAHHVIVHEAKLKKYLVEEYHCRSRKITVIPHGVEFFDEKPNSQAAKQSLGLDGKKVVLYLGYLTGYKGVELLIEAFEQSAKDHPDWVLLFGGGPHPRRKEEPEYQAYLKTLDEAFERLGDQARPLGFVPEEDLANVFSAADVVVFPYRVVISSSGPLALCIAYDRPFLASAAFEGVLSQNVLFDLTPEALAAKLEDFFASDQLTHHARDVSAEWQQHRNWKQVARRTLTVYETTLKGEAWQHEVARAGN